MEKEKATPDKKAALQSLCSKFIGTATETQRALMREALETLPTVSTVEARRDLDILHPAGRIMELRRSGVEIVTTWIDEVTSAGVRHRIGLYSLRRGVAP